MKLVKGNYEQARKTLIGYFQDNNLSLDDLLSECVCIDLCMNDSMKLYADLTETIEGNMIIKFTVSSRRAQNVSNFNSTFLNGLFEAKAVDKMVRKLQVNSVSELFQPKKTVDLDVATVSDLGDIMKAAKKKVNEYE